MTIYKHLDTAVYRLKISENSIRNFFTKIQLNSDKMTSTLFLAAVVLGIVFVAVFLLLSYDVLTEKAPQSVNDFISNLCKYKYKVINYLSLI